jgi:hypothetical protein
MMLPLVATVNGPWPLLTAVAIAAAAPGAVPEAGTTTGALGRGTPAAAAAGVGTFVAGVLPVEVGGVGIGMPAAAVAAAWATPGMAIPPGAGIAEAGIGAGAKFPEES